MNAPARIINTPERVRLTVEDFMVLADSGALDAYTKSELIDGDIYVMNAQYSPHARAKSRLLLDIGNQLLALASDLEALAEVSVRAAGDSMPEPDIVLTSWRGDGAVPVETVALIVEVSDTTRCLDLGRKAAIYAGAGVPEYWVVDLGEGYVRRHVRPGQGGYGAIDDCLFGSALEAATVAGLRVDTGRLAA
jgi:Uma2 family endonuclease